MTTITAKAMSCAAALLLLAATEAGARSLRTPPLQPGTNQKLVCTVVNLDGKSLEMQAEIVDRFGDNATDFTRTDWNADETVVLTLRVESSNPNARFCRITVRGGHRTDVAGSLQACSYDESTCTSPVVAR